MKYTAKHICKLLSISRETLRYYEKERLIHPEIDETNRYRYYDDWDINFLIEIIQYRNMGFSINEIKTIFTKDNLNEYISRIKTRRKIMIQESDYRHLIIDKNAEYLKSLELIPHRINTYELVYSPSLFLIPLRKDFEFIFSEQTNQLFPLVFNHFEFFENTVYIPYEDFQNKTESFYWTFTIEEKWVKELNISSSDMAYIKSCLCIRTVIDAKERWNFNYSLFEDSMKYISSNNLKCSGPVFGYLLARLHEDARYCRYIEIYIPVEKLGI